MNNEQVELDIRETIPFIIASKMPKIKLNYGVESSTSTLKATKY
jgi:hypothetical protein